MGSAMTRACAAEQVEQDLSNISSAMSSNQTFARFVKDPCISRKTKGEAMAAAVAGADETTRKLAGVLCYTYVVGVEHLCVRAPGRRRGQV